VFNVIKKFLYIVLSYIPILSVTADSNFGTNAKRFINNHKIVKGTRFSFLNIHFGKFKIYILTCIVLGPNNKKFNFIKILNLDKLIMADNFIQLQDDKATQYGQHYETLTPENCTIELEFIKYKLNSENERIKKAESKINSYSSIILVLIPIVMVFYKPEKICETTLLGKIIIIFLMICTMNAVSLILQHMFVKPLSLSVFSDIKNSQQKSVQTANNYYFEWQVFQKKADLDISYVKNIQNWIIGIIFMSLMFYFNSFIPTSNMVNISTKDSVYTINISNLDSKYSEDVQKVSNIHKFITDIKPKEIILMYGKNVNNINLNKISNQFDIYKDIDICKIIDTDYEEKDIIKIIIKGE
jgi:hypothetical protein